MTKIVILEYSLYGHITQLSRSIKKGIESVGVEVEHLRCADRNTGTNACSSETGGCQGIDPCRRE